MRRKSDPKVCRVLSNDPTSFCKFISIGRRRNMLVKNSLYNIPLILIQTAQFLAPTLSLSWASLTVFPSLFFLQLCPSFLKYLKTLRSKRKSEPSEKKNPCQADVLCIKNILMTVPLTWKIKSMYRDVTVLPYSDKRRKRRD